MRKNISRITRIAAIAMTAVMMLTGCAAEDGINAVSDFFSSITSAQDESKSDSDSNQVKSMNDYPKFVEISPAPEVCDEEATAGSYFEGACYDMCTTDNACIAFAPSEAYPAYNTEEYLPIEESGFMKAALSPLSTFAADVDTGSFCNLRRMIMEGYPIDSIPSGAIRTEELLNYFDYSVNNRSTGKFSVQSELRACPWDPGHGLLMMTVEANEVEGNYEGSNFVFLIDSSGSMGGDRIDLVKKSFKLLAETLTAEDRVSIVTYSGKSKVLLDGARGNDYERICNAIDSIVTGGCTNGEGGIIGAYDCALENYIEGGNNRVIIASDGDMNLGVTSTSGLTDLIREKKELGVFLTVLGYGSGNYSDANMESIADAGNGNYYYIDCEDEARNVLINKLKQTTVTVAKDVKFQAEFNPLVVAEYRLIGYENREMAAEDFADDTKDGGEVGAGQQVTVCYEIVYADGTQESSKLKYQETRPSAGADTHDILTLSVRYKEPEGETSKLEEYVIRKPEVSGDAFERTQSGATWDINMSDDFRLASGIIEASMLIRNSEYKGTATWEDALTLIRDGIEERPDAREMFERVYNAAQQGGDDRYVCY